MVNMVRALGNAEEEYYLINNSYTNDLDALSVTLPKSLTIGTENRYFIGDCGIRPASKYMSGILFKGDNRVAAYTFYYKNTDGNSAGQTRCITYASYKDLGDKICKSLDGKIISNRYSSCGTTGNAICNEYVLYHHH